MANIAPLKRLPKDVIFDSIVMTFYADSKKKACELSSIQE